MDNEEKAREGWEQVKRDLAAETYQLYVLDEFAYPMHWGWIDTDEVVEVLRDRPGTQHVVITGRNAPEKLVETSPTWSPTCPRSSTRWTPGRRARGASSGESIPRLVIAAPSSGSGKTTVATGLMAAFAGRGLAVSPHKVGPDYIDPGYHALATGRAGRNLDAYMCGPELVAPLFAHGARGCDLAVVEGVMGLYDGAAGQGELASTAHVAKLLRAPVVLVVDASSQSRSVAALVHGFASWDPEVRIGGVILNKVGSDRHEMLLREALDESGVPVLGVLRRADAGGHALAASGTGAGRRAAGRRGGRGCGDGRAGAGGCDLDALMALARSAPALRAAAWDPAEAVAVRRSAPRPARPVPGPGLRPGPRSSDAGRAGGRCPDGPAGPARRRRGRGAAFTFSYAEHAELLAAAGAEVVTFDPLRDEALPEGTRGLVIGGGFPEVYAPELSANEPLRKAVAELARCRGTRRRRVRRAAVSVAFARRAADVRGARRRRRGCRSG